MFITALACCCDDCLSPFSPLYDGVHEVWYAEHPEGDRRYTGTRAVTGPLTLVDVNSNIDTTDSHAFPQFFNPIGPDGAMWDFDSLDNQFLELERDTGVDAADHPIDITRDWTLSWWEQPPGIGISLPDTFRYDSLTGYPTPQEFGSQQSIAAGGYAGPFSPGGFFEYGLQIRIIDGFCGQNQNLFAAQPNFPSTTSPTIFEEVFFVVRWLAASRAFRFTIGIRPEPGFPVTLTERDLDDGEYGAETWIDIAHKTKTAMFYVKPLPPYRFQFASSTRSTVGERLFDQIAIWPYALSDEQVENVWNNGEKLSDDGVGFPH